MITLHSDDFGYKSYSDKKIIQLVRKDRIKSLSVLINMCEKKSLKSLVRLVRSKQNIKIGLHLNLIEGKSLDQKAYIPSLVNRRGSFYQLKEFVMRLFLGMINPHHIEREIKRQLRMLKNYGLKVSFIDSHQHLHAISPIAEIVNRMAQQEKIKIVRSYRNIKTYTLMAKIKFLALKSAATVSYYLQYHRVGLPVSWNGDSRQSYSFMSWESHNFDISRVKDKKLVFVTHPFLPFDTNKSYTWMLV